MFHLNSRSVTVLNRRNGIHLSACFGVGVDLLKQNQWNREHFSTGAYLDDQGCNALRSDVTFGGGATNRMIEEFVRQFCTDVAIFAKVVAQPPSGPNTPSASPAAVVSLSNRPRSPIGPMAWSQSPPYAKHAPPLPGAASSVPGLLKINPKISLRYDASVLHRWAVPLLALIRRRSCAGHRRADRCAAGLGGGCCPGQCSVGRSERQDCFQGSTQGQRGGPPVPEDRGRRGRGSDGLRRLLLRRRTGHGSGGDVRREDSIPRGGEGFHGLPQRVYGVKIESAHSQAARPALVSIDRESGAGQKRDAERRCLDRRRE
ncbi:MAG: YbjN domain-containing protein [Acidobacteriia bacterium]|nr:YbjN domain-containing protein [Terriglobia bacterium]